MPKAGPKISEFMTKSPHLVGKDQPLAKAHQLMKSFKIRHLPVLHGGRLVGLLSLRDLHLVETLRDVDPAEVKVEEAMSQEVFSVRPEASLRTVVREMARKKYGSAVVVDGRKVIGVFTTVDALRALDQALE
jgi:acetoin utilization protein AcuB